MKNLLTILALSCLLLVGCAPPGGGHGPGDPGYKPRATPAQRLDRRVSLLTSRLRLNPEQAQQVRVVLKADMDQRAALIDQYKDMSIRDKSEKLDPRLDELNERTEAQLARIFSAEQLRAYHELMAEDRDDGLRPGDRPGMGISPMGGMGRY